MSRGDLLEQGRRLLHPRLSESLLRAPSDSTDSRPPSRKRACRTRAPRGCRRRRQARRRHPHPSRAGARRPRRREGRRRGSACPPRGTRRPSPTARPSRDPRLGHPWEERLESRWSRRDSRRGAYSRRLSRSPRPKDSAHSRSVSRKSPTKRRSRPLGSRGAPAGTAAGRAPEEAAGVGDPEAARRVVLEPREVVEVAPVGDGAHGTARAERASPPRSPPRRTRSASARRATRRASCSFAACRARVAAVSERRWGLRRAGHGGPPARPSPSGPPPRRSGLSRAARS